MRFTYSLLLQLFLTILILFVFTVVPTTAFSSCQTIEITAVVSDPCNETILQKITIKINHTSGDLLGGSFVTFALILILDGFLQPQSPHGVTEHKQKPLIPPPRFS